MSILVALALHSCCCCVTQPTPSKHQLVASCPDVPLMLLLQQEVTPFILELFQQMPWWSQYTCSPPPHDAPYFTMLLVNRQAAPTTTTDGFQEHHFRNSFMGRSLRAVKADIGSCSVVVSTSHLEVGHPVHCLSYH